MTPAILKPLKIAAKIIISGLALYFVFRQIDPESIWDHLKQSNLVLLVAAGLFFILSKVISAFRLNYFFRSIRVNLTEKINLRLYWLGMFYNLFLPGGIGGDGYKVYYLHKNFEASIQKSLLAILFDRLTGLMSLGFLCILFALFLPENFFPSVYLIISMVFGIFIFYFVVYRWFRVFYSNLNVTNLLAMGTQISQVISAFLILKALGNEEQVIVYLFVFLISSVIAVIPFTIGGIGAREFTFLHAARILNLDLSISISLSLIFFLITALVSLYGIVYVFGQKDGSERDLEIR